MSCRTGCQFPITKSHTEVELPPSLSPCRTSHCPRGSTVHAVHQRRRPQVGRSLSGRVRRPGTIKEQLRFTSTREARFEALPHVLFALEYQE